WIELLKADNENSETITEVEKDVARLSTITERFSKIGSSPLLKNENLAMVLNMSVSYFKKRVSDKILFSTSFGINETILAPLNPPLFEWVIENIFKNAIDAMEGKGTLDIQIIESPSQIFIDITDSGKGIAKSRYNTIFKPGFTTKERGWGLGLSLSKRIIEEYHNGKIFIKKSEINKGTTMRIALNKIV
ncbi:MAG: ATP-binding protein, partial [Bacteroidota bacterium]